MFRKTGQKITFVHLCGMHVCISFLYAYSIGGLVSVKLMRDKVTNEPQGM